MSTAANKQNFIVFFTDQQRWDTVGTYGNPLGLTPNLDEIARRGTMFQRAFTPQPLCAPARSVMQTGRYPTATGCFRNGIPLPKHAPTIGRTFSDAGYATAYIGKWHLASGDPVPRDEQAGYQYWLAASELEWTSHPYDTNVFDSDGNRSWLPGYRTDALVDAAIRYIDRAVRVEDEPFFLFLSLLEPHHQNDVDAYLCPPGYERYAGDWMPTDLAALQGTTPLHLPGYLGMVKRIDEGVGRLVDALRSLNVLDSTNLLYTTDHGCHFRTRNAEYKRSCHEASIRIPMLAQGPYFDARGVVQQMVSLLDVPTMLCDAAGLQLEGAVGGVLGSRSHHNQQNHVVRQSDAISDDDGLLIQLSEAGIGRALRTNRWKYGVLAGTDDGEATGCAGNYVESHLYDLDADPAELTNLVDDSRYEAVRQQLRSELMARMRRNGEPECQIVSEYL
ncbi:MAG: sulfatase-like hydrolase/transferase [Actinomycetota bacterium]|nr:sulfatase-like hydrolase/transferase [Actinomycetota bacterium]